MFIPIVWDDSTLIGLAILLAIIMGVAIYSWLFPPEWKKLLKDSRYQQALTVYAGTIQADVPTDEDRQQAFAKAVSYLVNEHGISAKKATLNLRSVAAQYDRDKSYELRQEAIMHEEAGEYDRALYYYERAAWWQKGNDRKDCKFLQESAARVRRKGRYR